jgi:excisionase family DNA binding protein
LRQGAGSSGHRVGVAAGIPPSHKDSIDEPWQRSAWVQKETAAQSSLLNITEVARRLGVSTVTVYKLCDRGALPQIRVLNAVRITGDDLDAFVRRRRSNAGAKR